MIEVEIKFRLPGAEELVAALRELGAEEQVSQRHEDTYFLHPCRDFRATDEALRIRSINGVASVTYKGPKQPGPMKVREELEWCLAPGDTDGSNLALMLNRLGFEKLANVKKKRRIFLLPNHAVGVDLDDVETLGLFVEIEAMADEGMDVHAAKSSVQKLADQLGLREPEQKSYLTMVLEQQNH